MTPEQRTALIDILSKGEEPAPEWARVLFPPQRREYELVYGGKSRDEEVLAETIAVPLQRIRSFGTPAEGGQAENMLIFGDNLQTMKSLLEAKRKGEIKIQTGRGASSSSTSTRRLRQSATSLEPMRRRPTRTVSWAATSWSS